MLSSLWDLFQIPIVHIIIVPVRQWSDSLGAYQRKAGVNNDDPGWINMAFFYSPIVGGLLSFFYKSNWPEAFFFLHPNGTAFLLISSDNWLDARHLRYFLYIPSYTVPAFISFAEVVKPLLRFIDHEGFMESTPGWSRICHSQWHSSYQHHHFLGHNCCQRGNAGKNLTHERLFLLRGRHACRDSWCEQ